MYQFLSQYKWVKELFESDFIGNHHHIKVHFSWLLNDPNNIRLHQELGGAMWDVGCSGHSYTYSKLIGMKLVKVSMSGKIHPEYTADTTPTCIIIDDEYRTGEVFASMDLPFIIVMKSSDRKNQSL